MKLKNAKKSFATMFRQAEGNIFNDLLLTNIKIVESKKNKKKQRISLTVKTEWQAVKSAHRGHAEQDEIAPKQPETSTETAQASDVASTPAAPPVPPKNEIDETQKLTAEINKLQREIHALKSENRELSSQLYAIQQELEKSQKNLARKEEMLTETRKEIYEMKQAAQTQNYQPAYTPAQPSNAVLLRFGQEVDLYENEILSFTRKALEYALTNHTYEKSRYRHVLEDVLQANPLERDVRAEKEREFHKIMHTYHRMDNATRQALTKFGFTLNEQSVHHKIVFMQQSRYTFTISKTGSDIHGGKNCARNVSRFLF